MAAGLPLNSEAGGSARGRPSQAATVVHRVSERAPDRPETGTVSLVLSTLGLLLLLVITVTFINILLIHNVIPLVINICM
jgi:hypothetical protein